MKKKFIVTIYHETYTDYIVEADSIESAENLAMEGEYEYIVDVYVKQSDVISSEEYVDPSKEYVD
jgi:hypothetical protein